MDPVRKPSSGQLQVQERRARFDPGLYPPSAVLEARANFAERCRITDLGDFTLAIAPAQRSDRIAVDEFLMRALRAALAIHLGARETTT
jgi:hypothetical protein